MKEELFDIILRNAKIVNPSNTIISDIGIKKERILKIEKNIRSKAKNEIDLKEKYVFPGVIDQHVHFGLKAYGAKTADDFYSGSIEGVRGGVTTIIDYAIPKSEKHSIVDEVERRKKEALKNSIIDFSFHAQIVGWNKKIKEEVKHLINNGITSFKIFMPPTEGWQVSDYGIFNALKVTKEYGGLIEVHAENGSYPLGKIDELKEAKKTHFKYFPLTRPDFVEEEAIRRAGLIAEITGGRLVVVHLTSKRGLEAVKELKRRNVKIKVETCPQYLFLNNSVFKNKNGYLYLCCPPIKSKKDNLSLRNGITDGSIDFIGTDHCAFHIKDKKKGKGNFLKTPYGLPGIETSFPLLFDYFYKNGISLNTLAKITSYNQAKAFGIRNKGEIKEKYFADLIIIDAKKKKDISRDTLATNTGWYPYNKKGVLGFPEIVIRRGEIIFKGDKIYAKKLEGKFLKREKIFW